MILGLWAQSCWRHDLTVSLAPWRSSLSVSLEGNRPRRSRTTAHSTASDRDLDENERAEFLRIYVAKNRSTMYLADFRVPLRCGP